MERVSICANELVLSGLLSERFIACTRFVRDFDSVALNDRLVMGNDTSLL